MFFNKQIVNVQRTSPTACLEVDATTPSSLSYYIVDPTSQYTISALEYKLDKLSGRDTTNVIPWTSVDISGVTGDTYNIEISLTGVTSKDQLRLTLRTTDTDSVEFFYEDNEVEAI